MSEQKQGNFSFQYRGLGDSNYRHHEAQFLLFHAENPHVYHNLVRMARMYRDSKRTTKFGIATLWEVLRWDYSFSTAHEGFKLNNNHKAFYARMIMDRNPDLAGMFELREQRA